MNASADAEVFASNFFDMFESACNGRWPQRNHQPHVPTIEEEVEDMKLRAQQPRLQPSIDDLVLAQEKTLERSEIRK